MANDWLDEDWPGEEGDGDWTGALDDEHARWLQKWTSPCPDGDPQRVAVCLGYRELEPGTLQLRVALGGADHGVCNVIVEDTEEAVRVRMLVCMDADRLEANEDPEYVNCPVRVYLDQPLGDRTVIDVQTDKPVPLFVPSWVKGSASDE